MIAHEFDQRRCRERQHVLVARRPQRRHHREEVVRRERRPVPLPAQVLPDRRAPPRIAAREQEEVARPGVEPRQVPEEGAEFGSGDGEGVREQAAEVPAAPLPGAGVEAHGQAHVGVLPPDAEALEPARHVGVIPGVVHHETDVDVHLVLPLVFVVVVVLLLLLLLLVVVPPCPPGDDGGGGAVRVLPAGEALRVQGERVRVTAQSILGFEEHDVHDVDASSSSSSSSLMGGGGGGCVVGGGGVQVPRRREAGYPPADDGDALRAAHDVVLMRFFFIYPTRRRRRRRCRRPTLSCG